MHKGQVTIYILLGIVILFILGIGIYVTNKFFFQTPFITLPETDINNYITDCLTQTSIQVIQKLGAHGGYVDPFNLPLSRRTFIFDTDQTESDALFLSPPKNNPVVYWWYLKSNNHCKECDLSTKNKPTLDEEVKQLEQTILAELPTCFNNFAPFISKGYHVTTGTKRVQALLTENDVEIFLDMPTTISRAGSETKENQFETTLDVPLKKIHTTAETLVQDAIANQRLETRFLHALALSSGVDPMKLPPLSAVTHTTDIVSWTKQLVHYNVQQLLTSFIPRIQPTQTPPKDAFSYTITKQLYDFTFDFVYLDQPIYFDINPTSKNKLLPDTDRTTFPLRLSRPFQTNYYEFFYDVSAPILVRIHAPQALHGKGYTFNLGLELNIRRNKHLLEYHLGEGTIAPWDSTQLKVDVTETNRTFTPCERRTEDKFICPLTHAEYNETRFCTEACFSTKTETTPVPLLKTFFCDAEQRLSGTTRITVLDALTNKPIPEASVTYACGKQHSCTLGATNKRGIYRQKLPICTNGMLTITAEKYHPHIQPFSTQYITRNELTIKLNPLKTVSFSIRKAVMSLQSDSTITCCTYAPIGPFEKIFFHLERIKEHPWDQEFSVMTQYDTTQAAQTIDLIQGTYSITATMLDNLGFIIPKGCKRVQLQLYPDENKIIKPAILGGLDFSNETLHWKISQGVLAQTRSIEFIILKLVTPTCLDTTDCVLPQCVGLGELGKIAEYSAQHKEKLQPRVI